MLWRVVINEEDAEIAEKRRRCSQRGKGRLGVTTKPGRPRSLKYPDGTPVEVEGVSRQRRWQIARRAAGKCEWCGQPLNKYAAMCDDCAKKIRERARKRGGFKAWKPGSRGRPPKDAAKSKLRKKKSS